LYFHPTVSLDTATPVDNQTGVDSAWEQYKPEATRTRRSKVKWSQSQQAHRQRFKQAVAYAKATMAEPTVRASYEKAAAKAGKRPFDLAVSDNFKGHDLLAKN
jgi:hypothetical protein